MMVINDGDQQFVDERDDGDQQSNDEKNSSDVDQLDGADGAGGVGAYIIVHVGQDSVSYCIR